MRNAARCKLHCPLKVDPENDKKNRIPHQLPASPSYIYTRALPHRHKVPRAHLPHSRCSGIGWSYSHGYCIPHALRCHSWRHARAFFGSARPGIRGGVPLEKRTALLKIVLSFCSHVAIARYQRGPTRKNLLFLFEILYPLRSRENIYCSHTRRDSNKYLLDKRRYDIDFEW